jgi:hypothetical protein
MDEYEGVNVDQFMERIELLTSMGHVQGKGTRVCRSRFKFSFDSKQNRTCFAYFGETKQQFLCVFFTPFHFKLFFFYLQSKQKGSYFAAFVSFCFQYIVSLTTNFYSISKTNLTLTSWRWQHVLIVATVIGCLIAQ